MPRSTEDYLRDILRAAEIIVARTKGLDQADFFGNDVLVDSILFNLVTIGEACHHLPADLRA